MPKNRVAEVLGEIYSSNSRVPLEAAKTLEKVLETFYRKEDVKYLQWTAKTAQATYAPVMFKIILVVVAGPLWRTKREIKA